MGPDELERALGIDEPSGAPAARTDKLPTNPLDRLIRWARDRFLKSSSLATRGAMEMGRAEDARSLQGSASIADEGQTAQEDEVPATQEEVNLEKAILAPEDPKVIFIFRGRKLEYRNPNIARKVQEAIDRQSVPGIPDQVGKDSSKEERQLFLSPDSLQAGDVLFREMDTESGKSWVPVVLLFGRDHLIGCHYVKDGEESKSGYSSAMCVFRHSRVLPDDDNGLTLGAV